MSKQEIGKPLEQWRYFDADHSLRKSAMEKKDSRILATAPHEIVGAKVCYHRTCYKGYTRTEASHNGTCNSCGESLEDEYAHLKSEITVSDQMSLQMRK